MAKKNDKGPATTSAAYDEMAPTWDKLDTVLKGTDAMRAAGRSFLPQHEEEGDLAYQERLSRSTLLNMLQMTIDAWVGKPFSEPIHVDDTVPQAIQDLFENIDLQGNNLEVFSRHWFRDGLHKGFSHVYVDFPRPLDLADGQPRTLADDRDEKLRPYWIHIVPENLIFAAKTTVNGYEEVTHIRIRETVVQKTGWEETVVNRIRVIEPGYGRVYEERIDPKTKKPVWVMVDEYNYDLPFIPLVTFYAERQDFMLSKPPLSDLADLNINHWQSNSDQNSVLTVARFPILGVSGAISDDKLTIGPNQWLHCPDPAGRFYYVEHTGKAIAAGRQHLMDLEETMAEYGATFLKKRPGGASATARALDSAETTSPLQDMTIRFQSALNQALAYLGKWLKIDDVGKLEVNLDFDQNEFNQPAAQALVSARCPLNPDMPPDISRERFVKELHRMGVLGEDFDAKADSKLLDQEQKDALDKQKQQLILTKKFGPKPAAPAVPGGKPPAKPATKGGPQPNPSNK